MADIDVIGYLDKIEATVTAGSSDEIVDNTSTDFKTIEWILKAEDSTNSKNASKKILSNNNGTDITHTIYAVLGDSIDFDINIDISGGNVRFKITNNESVDLDFVLIKIFS